MNFPQDSLLNDKRVKYSFLCLIILQLAHFLEEYLTGFYKNFAMYGYFERTFSSVLQAVFLSVNTLMVLFLLTAYVLIYKPQWHMKLLLFFALVEIWNGAHHILWSAVLGAYFPGAVTGALLLLPAAYIFKLYFTESKK